MDAAGERALLGGVAIFKGLDDRALDGVLRAAERRRVAQGDTVFRQDEAARAFYVLTPAGGASPGSRPRGSGW